MIARHEALEHAQILVLEDDYYLATDLQQALEAGGATVLGPFGDEADANSILSGMTPSCAFVDVNLGSGPSFDVPHRLLASGIPFAFVTGYDAGTIPEEFAGVPRLEKPVSAARIIETAARLLRPGSHPV